MKDQNKVLLLVLLNIFVFGNIISLSLANTNPYLKGVIASLKNKDFIEASGQYGGGYGGGLPTVTINVEQLTTNRLPNITGTCSIGNDMTFVVKTGPTYATVSETITKICDVSPYALTPTIQIPDGKYKVDVSIETYDGCSPNCM